MSFTNFFHFRAVSCLLALNLLGVNRIPFGLKKMDFFFIQPETGCTTDPSFFFDQMGNDDSLQNRDVSLFDRVVKTLVI